MDLTKLSDEDLQALSGGDMTKLSDEGLNILAGTPTTQPIQPSLFDKAIGAGEAGLSTLTGLTGGMVAGSIGGLQGILDTVRGGTFGTQAGIKEAGDKFHEQAAVATYEPRTELGKEYAGGVGKFISEQAPSLIAVAPQLEGLSALSRFKKTNASLKPKEPSAAAKAAAEFDAKKATQDNTPVTGDYVPELPNTEHMLSEAGYSKALEHSPVEQPLPFVPELYKGDAPLLQGHTKKHTAPMTESERLAAEREQSISDPLKFERTPVEPGMLDYVPQEAGLPFSVEGKLATPVEMGTHAKSVQQGIRDVREIASEVEQLKTDLVDKTEVGPEQRMAIQSLEHDLQNASGRTAANLEEVAQIGRDLAQLKIKTAEGTKAPKQVGPNRGKFGQGGAITPDVFLGVFPEFATSKIVDAVGKLKVLYHGGKALVSGMPTKGTGIYGEGVYLTDSPGRANQYAKSGGGTMYPAYVDIKNPISSTEYANRFGAGVKSKERAKQITEQLKQEGYDGVVSDMIGKHWEVVSFYPEKAIKSATSGATPKQQTLAKDSSLANKMSERLGTPLGQTGFGKGQKGSIGFFGKDPFEKFAENLRKEVPNVSEEAIKYAWDKQQAQASIPIREQQQAVKQGQAYTEITGLDPKITGEVWSPEKAVEIFKTTPDIENRSFLKEQVVSSGRIQRDLLNHPATTWVYNLTTQAVENGRLMARRVLDDFKTGLIPKIHSNVALSIGGAKEMRELMKWRFENEGQGRTLPETFSAKTREINDLMNKADEQLLAKMTESLAKDGKKPITAIDNHMVHYWSGPYRAYIYVKTESGGSKLGFFVSEKSMKDAQKAMDWIKANVPTVDPVKTTDVSFIKSDIRNRTSMFDHLLDLSNEKDPVVLEALQAFKNRVEQGQATHLGEQHRQKYRAGVQGFSGSKPWFNEARNYADSIDMVRTKYDAGYQWIAAQEIRQQMNPILEAQKNGEIAVGKALTLGQRYVDHALGKNIDVSVVTKAADYLEDIYPNKAGPLRRGMNELQHVASKVTLPYLLALKGTQAVQAILQVPMSTIPKMLELRAAWGGDYTNMGTALAHGSVDGLFQFANTLTGGKFEPLARQLMQVGGKDLSETSQAIHRYMEENDIARMSLSDTGASREGGFFKTLGNTAADVLLNAPMNLFEGPTRSWAFSSYVRQAVKDGHPIETALRIAHEQMDSMVNYNPEASAMGLSNLGAAGQEAKGLHTFMINYYSQLYRYIDVAKNQKQAGPLLTYLGLTFAAGGAVGFIGADLADWLLDGIKTASHGKPWDTPDLQKMSVRKWLMDNTPEAISVGPLSTTTGLGLYGSFTTKVVDPERSFLENTFPKTTASLQIAKGLAQSPRLLDSDLSLKDRGTILENMSPKYLTQSIRNKYQNKDGVVYDPNADRAGLPMYQRTEKEQKISERGFGVRGLAENMSQEDLLQYYKGTTNVTASEEAHLTKLDSLIVAAMKSGKEPTAFQKKAIQERSADLIGKWGMGEDKFQTHIEKLAESYGIPADSLRKLVNTKDKTLKDVAKIQDLSAIVNRQKERQGKYGNWN